MSIIYRFKNLQSQTQNPNTYSMKYFFYKPVTIKIKFESTAKTCLRLNLNETKNHGQKTLSARAIAALSAAYSIFPNLIWNEKPRFEKICVRDCYHRSITFMSRAFLSH